MTVIGPVVGPAARAFLTASVYVPFGPTVKPPVCDLLSERSGGTAAGSTAVGSLASLFPVLISPVVLTDAVFVTLGTAALPTATPSENELLAPAASAFA